MDLHRVILGSIVTEKAERLKASGKRMYTLHIAQHATKIDVKNALRKLYDVKATTVRIVRVGKKTRLFGRSQVLQKRDPYKKALVTLSTDSKTLDLNAFAHA